MTLHPAHDIRNPHGASLTRHRDAVGCNASWTCDMQCRAHFMISVDNDSPYIGLKIGIPRNRAGRYRSSLRANRLASNQTRLTGRDSSNDGRL